ncbi:MULTISPECIES: hypothetical protein [unclassified Bradyrhizobium]|uniref:hypothetical protein n=1 Tax=unclassified Bradyrhizobium TaxID=2631580 RepID=UPI002916377C|nr:MULTISPECIES: hypothetical protein [unclassified Bradyrhizobium]
MIEFFHSWVLKPELLAGWLQAGAAIAALAISCWAVLWTSASSRRRDRLELRGLAVAVFPEIMMLKASIPEIRKDLADIPRRYKGLVGQSIAAELQMRTSIPLPPMMERNVDKLFLLGEVAGPSCLHLVRLIMQYNSTIDGIAAHVAVMNAEQWVEAVRQIDDHLKLLDGVVAKCENEVKPIHDAIKG